MTYLAALLAGLGGLLVELVLVRRHGLLLGNTSSAAAVVLSLFLLGLGVGGWGAGWLAARRRPRVLAACLYGMVAVASVCCDAWLRDAASSGWPVGLVRALVAPGALAVAMGMAFPMLFALQRGGPWRTGGLVGANLAGSVIAAWLGGNVWIPALGLTLTTYVGASAYGAAALLVACGGGAPTRSAPTGRLRFCVGARPALAAGVLVLGLQVLLLRRLPFWLEGLQPTLSGVVAACLLGLAAGSALGTPLFAALFGRRAAYVALAVGAVTVSAGLHELWVPGLAQQSIASDLGLHIRIFAASTAAAFVPCFALGAVVPLLLTRLGDRPGRTALAGRLFLWQGLGALVGALLVSQALPRVCPEAYFAAVPPVLAATAALVCWRAGGWPMRFALGYAVLAAFGFGGAGSVLAPSPPVSGSRYDRPEAYRYVAHRSDSGVTASVVYDRRQLSMALYTDGFRAAETGPGTAYMKALGHLPMLLRPDLRRLAVVALGTGTTANALATWPDATEIHVVEISPAVFSLVPFFSGDGPLGAGLQPALFSTDPRTRAHVADGRRFLTRRAAGSLDLVTLEPLLPYAPGTGPLYTSEFYQLAGDALSDRGLLVQWVPTHAMPASTFDVLLATFARSFSHTSVWLIDQSTILVGSKQPHVPDRDALRARFDALPDGVASALHETGLARPIDVEVAFVGDDPLAVCGDAPTLDDDRPFVERVGYWSGRRKLEFYPENLGRLQAIAASAADGAISDDSARQRRVQRLSGLRRLAQAPWTPDVATLGGAVRDLATVRAAWPDSVLLHREETLALRALIEREVHLRQGRNVAALARRHLRRDLRSALLWAGVALPDSGGATPEPEVRREAVATAHALDPLLFHGRYPYLGDLARFAPAEDVSPLEDVARLPADDALVEVALVEGATGRAVQAAFPVRVARALISRMRDRPLDESERSALRPALDPLSLQLATDAVTARGGDIAEELYPLWRSDMPMPMQFRIGLSGDAAARLRLARVLRGHRGPHAASVVAELMMDADEAVRTEVSVTLFSTWGDRVPYDPQWGESRRRKAADGLRSLHNPGS